MPQRFSVRQEKIRDCPSENWPVEPALPARPSRASRVVKLIQRLTYSDASCHQQTRRLSLLRSAPKAHLGLGLQTSATRGVEPIMATSQTGHDCEHSLTGLHSNPRAHARRFETVPTANHPS